MSKTVKERVADEIVEATKCLRALAASVAMVLDYHGLLATPLSAAERRLVGLVVAYKTKFPDAFLNYAPAPFRVPGPDWDPLCAAVEEVCAEREAAKPKPRFEAHWAYVHRDGRAWFQAESPDQAICIVGALNAEAARG